MARDMIVLEGNVGDEAVPLLVLFLYRGLPDITDDAGNVVVPTPQDVLSDEAKALLDQRELDALDAGTLAAEVVQYNTDEGVATREDLKSWVQYLQRLYWHQRAKFLKQCQDKHSLRGLVIDARETGGGIKVSAVQVEVP